MHYKRLLSLIDSVSSYLSVGLDVGADFTWMSIALPNGSFIGKPFKIIHSDPRSRDLAVTKIKEAQETYSLKSRCFLESTGIYHIPLLCFLRDKGFDCSVINPIITKNSTNINIRKLHNDKFDSKKAALVGLNVSLKTSILPDDSVVDLRNLVRDYYYFKDLQSAVALKLTAELKVSFPAYAKVFSKVTTQSSLKLLSSYPLPEDMLAASKEDIVDIIRSTARFGEAYALRKYDAIISAAQDAAVFGRALPSNAVRIRLYIDTYQEYQKHLDALLKALHETVEKLQDTLIYDQICLLQSLYGIGFLSAVVLVADQSILHPFNRLMERFQERIQMLLVFQVSIDIKADADRIAGKRPAKNSSILCGSDDGVILTQGIRFAKTCGTADDLHNVIFGSGKDVLGKRIRA